MEENKEERKLRNKDLIRRLKAGEDLSTMSMQDSWFPPRPIIKKDTEKMLDMGGKPCQKREKPLSVISTEPSPITHIDSVNNEPK